MESLPIPDELLAEILLRLPSPDDLARASAACASFRRVAADRAFLRRYRKLHPSPLLGFLDAYRVFHPADQPHPSAPAASAVALAADFSLSFLPAPANARCWDVQDVCDGRVLLNGLQRSFFEVVFTEMVVCDPLHRRYLLLPPIPDDLTDSVEVPFWKSGSRYCEAFLVPSEDDDDETSFRVIWMVQRETKLVAALFSSSTGQWRTVSTQSWTDLFAGLLLRVEGDVFDERQYTDGCFYWVRASRDKLLVLDTRRMEFSIADLPPEVRGDDEVYIGMVEAEEGGPGMFVYSDMTFDLSYYTHMFNGGSSGKWHKEKTLSLGSGFIIRGSMGYCLLLNRCGASAVEPGLFTLDVKTFQLEKVCASKCYMPKALAYLNFPPSLLSTPRVSSGTQEGTERRRCKLKSPLIAHHNESSDDAGGQTGVWRIGDGC